MSASALTPRPLPDTPEDVEGEWTDEELEALSIESENEPGESVDGRVFFKNLLEELRQRTEAAR